MSTQKTIQSLEILSEIVFKLSVLSTRQNPSSQKSLKVEKRTLHFIAAAVNLSLMFCFYSSHLISMFYLTDDNQFAKTLFLLLNIEKRKKFNDKNTVLLLNRTLHMSQEF